MSVKECESDVCAIHVFLSLYIFCVYFSYSIVITYDNTQFGLILLNKIRSRYTTFTKEQSFL